MLAHAVIEHSGWIQDMPGLLAASHRVCLPSYYGEGIPKVLLKAMACDLPCITTNTRGCKEAVRNGENGFLVSPNEPQSLAYAIRELVNSSVLRRKMGEAGRRIAIDEYNEMNVSNRTMELFEERLKII